MSFLSFVHIIESVLIADITIIESIKPIPLSTNLFVYEILPPELKDFFHNTSVNFPNIP